MHQVLAAGSDSKLTIRLYTPLYGVRKSIAIIRKWAALMAFLGK